MLWSCHAFIWSLVGLQMACEIPAFGKILTLSHGMFHLKWQDLNITFVVWKLFWWLKWPQTTKYVKELTLNSAYREIIFVDNHNMKICVCPNVTTKLTSKPILLSSLCHIMGISDKDLFSYVDIFIAIQCHFFTICVSLKSYISCSCFVSDGPITIYVCK